MASVQIQVAITYFITFTLLLSELFPYLPKDMYSKNYSDNLKIDSYLIE